MCQKFKCLMMLHFIYTFPVCISLQDNNQLLKTLTLDGAFVVDMEEYYRHSGGNVT